MKLDSSLAAIVTGGASGLGEATARMLASQGVKVALLDLNAERGEALAKEIGGIFALCDVTSEASVDEALAKARAAHGIARIIVKCAGIAPGRRVGHIHEGMREIPHKRIIALDGIPFILSKPDELERRAPPGIADVALVGDAEDADDRIADAV